MSQTAIIYTWIYSVVLAIICGLALHVTIETPIGDLGRIIISDVIRLIRRN